MRFLHILVVIFMAALGVHGHKNHRHRISSQMHLNAIEYIIVCERTQRLELRKMKKEQNTKISKTTEKKIAMENVKNRRKWHYYDLFLL